jgi:3',5'-cyclic AMP phosphodiesterase CpdA
MKIAVLSDPHIGSSNPVFVPNWDKVVAAVNARDDLDLAVVLGDLTLYGSEKAEDLPFGARALEALRLPTRVLPGNHDVGDISRDSHQPATSQRLADWDAHFGPSFWHTDALDGWRLIGLNSQILDTGLPEEAAQWAALEAALAGAGDREIVVFTHVPLFLEGWDEADRPAWAIMSTARTRLRGLICDHDVRAVVTGHMHRTAQIDLEETRLIWCAASSFLTYDGSMPPQPGDAQLGVTVLTLDETGVQSEVMEIDGLMISRIEDYNGSIYASPAKE